MKEKTSCPAFNKQRLGLKTQSLLVIAQFRNQKEKLEYNTYKSNMTLLDTPPAQKHMNILNIDILYKYGDNNLGIVFFDLKTNSSKGDCDSCKLV